MSQELSPNGLQSARIISVHKSHAGKDINYSWQGTLLEESPTMRKIKAYFSGKPGSIVGVAIEVGDKWIETYYTDRWYNCFQMHAGDSNTLKMLYFNICRPAVFSGSKIEWDDLALDLVVLPDGSRFILDQDEFAALDLDAKTRRICWQTLSDLLTTDLARFWRS